MIGQTFTAGPTGPLDTVRLTPAKSLVGAPVTIRATSAGLPADPVLATSFITSASANDWVDVVFASPASVVAGTQYAIVVGQVPDLVGSPQHQFPVRARLGRPSR